TGTDAANRTVGVGMRVSNRNYECLIINTNRGDDRGLCLQLPNRIPHPGGRRVLRESAAIRENLAIMALVLEKSDRHERSLHMLERGRPDEERIGHTVG